MRVLIIGSGGRESAFAWSINKSPKLEALYCAPGNPGTATLAKNLDINIKDFNAIKRTVIENGIGLVIVGPEEPLVNGLGDFSNLMISLRISFLLVRADKVLSLREARSSPKSLWKGGPFQLLHTKVSVNHRLLRRKSSFKRFVHPMCLRLMVLQPAKGW